MLYTDVYKKPVYSACLLPALFFYLERYSFDFCAI